MRMAKCHMRNADYKCSNSEYESLNAKIELWRLFGYLKNGFIRIHMIMQYNHYSDVIMGTMASQITCLTIVYSTVYSEADQRKHQSFASLAFVPGIHRWPVNSPHKWPITRKILPFDDVIMMFFICYTLYISCSSSLLWHHVAMCLSIKSYSKLWCRQLRCCKLQPVYCEHYWMGWMGKGKPRKYFMGNIFLCPKPSTLGGTFSM